MILQDLLLYIYIILFIFVIIIIFFPCFSLIQKRDKDKIELNLGKLYIEYIETSRKDEEIYIYISTKNVGYKARRNRKERERAGKPNGYSRSVTWVLSYIFPQEGGNVVS